MCCKIANIAKNVKVTQEICKKQYLKCQFVLEKIESQFIIHYQALAIVQLWHFIMCYKKITKKRVKNRSKTNHIFYLIIVKK